MNKIRTGLSAIGTMLATDVKNFIDWVWTTRSINGFDPDVLSYPRTIMSYAHDSEGALIYIPIQPVLMFESIAAKPGLSPRREALSLWKIGQMLDEVSQTQGYQEQIFMCKDDRVADICVDHGFTEMKGYRVLRKKIALPKKDEQVG